MAFVIHFGSTLELRVYMAYLFTLGWWGSIRLLGKSISFVLGIAVLCSVPSPLVFLILHGVRKPRYGDIQHSRRRVRGTALACDAH